MHHAGPDLAVPVGVGGVERRVGRRQPIFEDALLGGVELHQHAAAAGGPVVVVGVEFAARRPRIGARVRLEHFPGLGVHDDDAVARPGAAAEVAAILAHGAAVGAGKLLGRIARHQGAGERVDLAHQLVARSPKETVGIERDVADRRRVHRLADLPGDALEVAVLRVEAIDVMPPVLRAPDDVVLVDRDPMRAGQNIGALARNLELLDGAGLGIEPADIGAAVRAVPDVALGIGRHVVGGKLEPRQFILGDDDAGLPSLRPRQRHERRVLGVGAAHRREPFDEARGVLVVEAPARPHVDQGRAGALGHAVDDVAPARLVVVVAEDLLIGMAPVAVDGEQLLLIARPGQAHEPFGAGHLGRDLGRVRQQLAIGDAGEHDLLELVRAADLHLLLHKGTVFARLRDPQRVAAGVELGEFIAAIHIGVDRGAHRILLRDELHHHAFDEVALARFHDAARAAQELVPALCQRGRRNQQRQRAGQDRHP